MRREEKIVARINKSDIGIEIGPGYNPLLPKVDGWSVLSVDHAKRELLIEKYKSINVDTSKIEDVDIVWSGGPLDEAVPENVRGRLHYCVASHVIEHIPNPIAFFQSCEKLLKPGGILSLAVPDKRYCFDFFQPLTSTADLLHAWKRGATVHSGEAMFQHAAYTVKADDATTWGQKSHLRQFAFLRGRLNDTLERFERYSEEAGAPYEDCHAWHLTPSSFALILLELSQLGLIKLSVDTMLPSVGCEFFVTLRNTPSPGLPEQEFNQRRLMLMKEALRELYVQWEMVEPPRADVGGRFIRALRRLRRHFSRT